MLEKAVYRKLFHDNALAVGIIFDVHDGVVAVGVKRLADGFTALSPLYRLLTEAVEEARGLRMA